ncbi:hypothetical protein L3556_16010 [Candidatus Synechococcus calcipolaris G9]|uniref:Transposase n=1 Tax=Candidatus Synechococcus calcipolaris G9 TaxID=1497997 RepID=A0ABT6F3H9_9SYNE|nr:hypothetical protein [Candidatus Synechococcus calcipolaris]MDG2992424.1 hypothetical protein [Candidatus Synechococcus calcipolaris G9]
MARIVGLDISNSFIYAASLDHPVDQPREWFRENREMIARYDAESAGIKALLALKPDYAVLEPTGVHYGKLWADHLAGSGVKLLWVGHAQLKSYRLTLRLPNKNDQADAFALAQYGQCHLGQSGYFLAFDLHSTGYQLRQSGLQIRYLESLTTEIKNRLRQQLSHEWPEVSQSKTKGALWRFIAGRAIPARMQTIYGRCLESSIGSGLSDFTQFLANQLVTIEDKISQIEAEMVGLYHNPCFAAYQRVFSQYGFGDRVASCILSHIYPLENFLGTDGLEIVETVKGNNGKPSKRYRSLNSFKLMLGMGLVEDSSGKSERWIPGGSTLCRLSLWQWLFTRIEVKRSRPKSDRGQQVSLELDRLKATGTPIKLVRSRVIRKAVEWLFYDLLDALSE